MAKESMKARERKRERLVERFAKKREALTKYLNPQITLKKFRQLNGMQ